MPWRDVSDQEAVDTEYYGVGGWLMLFYVVAVLSLASSVLDVIAPDPKVVAMLGDSMSMTRAYSAIATALQIPFLVLVPMKHWLMPPVEIACTWLQLVMFFPVSIGLAEMTNGTVAVIVTILIVVLAALWTWYLLRSKRVNLTYRSRVPAWAY